MATPIGIEYDVKIADPGVSVSKQVRRGVPEKQIDTKHCSITRGERLEGRKRFPEHDADVNAQGSLTAAACLESDNDEAVVSTWQNNCWKCLCTGGRSCDGDAMTRWEHLCGWVVVVVYQ